MHAKVNVLFLFSGFYSDPTLSSITFSLYNAGNVSFLQCFNQSEVTVSAGLCRAAGGDAPNSGSNTDCHRTAPPIDEDNHANIIINDKNPKDVRL